MKRTLMATAVLMALAVSTAVWAQGTTETPAPGTAPGTTSDATTQTGATPATTDASMNATSSTTTSEMPSTASPLALLAASGVLSLIAGARLTRRRD